MNSATLPALDLSVIFLYLVGVIIFGSFFFKKIHSLDDFTVGSRSLPGWALGLSILGTYLSSVSFLGLPGKAYTSNWSAFVFSLSIPIVCVFASRWFIPLFRGRLQTTAYEHLESRFGYWARAYTAFSLVMLQIGRVGIVLYLMALSVEQLLGWDIRLVIVILGLGTLLYCSLGGIEAVVWTDVIQTIILVGGAIACAVIAIFSTTGGAGEVWNTAWSENKLTFGGWDFDFALEGFWVVLLYGMVENLKNFGVDQNFVLRYLSAKSDREARKSLWLGGVAYVPVSALFFLIGTSLYVYYKSMAAKPEGFPASGDQVFPFFIVKELPVGVTGLVISAILAAGMSTLSSSLNSAATVWTVDFHKRLIRPSSSDHEQLWVTRLATAAVGLIGGTVALLVAIYKQKNALDTWWMISGVFGGGMLGLFLLGIMVRRAGRAAAVVGTVASVIVIGWATYFGVIDIARQTWRQGSPESVIAAGAPIDRALATKTGSWNNARLTGEILVQGAAPNALLEITVAAGEKTLTQSAPLASTASGSAAALLNLDMKGAWKDAKITMALKSSEGAVSPVTIQKFRLSQTRLSAVPPFPFHKFLVGLAGALTTILIGLAVATIKPATPAPEENLVETAH